MSCCKPPAPKPVAASCCGGGGMVPAQPHHMHTSRPDALLWGSAAGVALLYGLHLANPALLTGLPWLAKMAATAAEMVHATWWGVLIGMVFLGLLSKVPQEFVLAILGRGGTVGGLLRATGAGVLLDLCSHGILMVGAKLYQRGASAGQLMAFLLASPWNSFSLTLILIGLVGWQWTFAFIGLSMLIALLTGWVFDKLVAGGVLPETPHGSGQLDASFRFWPEARQRLRATTFNAAFFSSMALSGLKDSRMVLRWLLFGILLAAALRALIDPSLYQTAFGPTMLGLLVTVSLATVLEVCSEGSTPIAADILNHAGAPGNAFAFLMAGVATDYTEIMVLKDATRSWKIALFLPLISVPQIMLVAWVINTAM